MDLDDFIISFNKLLYLLVPEELLKFSKENNNKYLATNECKDNLYPNYKDYNLRFLKGLCIIFNNTFEKKPFIKLIFSPKLKENFEDRLLNLFKTKKT